MQNSDSEALEIGRGRTCVASRHCNSPPGVELGQRAHSGACDTYEMNRTSVVLWGLRHFEEVNLERHSLGSRQKFTR